MEINCLKSTSRIERRASTTAVPAAAVEVACNLSDVRKSSQGAVLDKVRQLAGEQGLEVDGKGYTTGIEPEDIIKKVHETTQVLI